MAYHDSVGDNAQLLRRTVCGLANFSGRSRRTEVLYYWIASALVGATLKFVVSTVVTFETSLFFDNALQLVLIVPMFALYVRRLHDQGKSGWWGFLLPLSLLLSIPGVVSEFRGDGTPMIAQKATPMNITAGLCGLALIVLCLLRGTEGANSYGLDPRLEEV